MLQKPQTDLFHKQPCMEQTYSAEKITAKQNKIKKTNKQKQGEIKTTQRYLKICLLLWELEEKASLESLLVNIKEKHHYRIILTSLTKLNEKQGTC